MLNRLNKKIMWGLVLSIPSPLSHSLGIKKCLLHFIQGTSCEINYHQQTKIWKWRWIIHKFSITFYTNFLSSEWSHHHLHLRYVPQSHSRSKTIPLSIRKPAKLSIAKKLTPLMIVTEIIVLGTLLLWTDHFITTCTIHSLRSSNNSMK